MRIENIRFGHAANSSSTHSVVFFDDYPGLKDRDVEDEQFGWDEWSAASQDAKRAYLSQTLMANISHKIGKSAASALCQAWIGHTPNENSHGVDHQSLMTLPLNWEGHICEEFVREWAQFYLDPRIAIVGGNDNSEHVRFTNHRHDFVLPTDRFYGSSFVCRKDGDYWTIFDRHSGLKLRLTFKKDALPYTKSQFPELVDLKITDFCSFNCKFCYQGSTVDGKHAKRSYIDSILYALEDMQVFEIAYGGGEPTSYPDFWNLLTETRKRGIVPNFTTKNESWIRDLDKVKIVNENVGRVAFSVHSPWAISQILDNCGYNDHQLREDKVSFHYVLSTMPEKSLKELINTCAKRNAKLTLLGYKTQHRGSNFKQINNDRWIEFVKESKSPIGIDTATAQQYSKQLQKQIEDGLVTVEEGKFSMYIDAVEGKIAPSSYCSPEQRQNLDVYKMKEIFLNL